MTQATTYGGAPKQRRTLAAIVEELLHVIDEADGEVTARVEEIGLELEDKVQAFAAVIDRLKAEQEAFDDLAHAYKTKCAERDNQVTALKFRLEQALTAAGVEKIKTPTCTVSFASTKAVHVENETAFLDSAEDRFVNVKQSVNKTALKEALEAGEQIDGAELKTNRHLRIR